ncbi:PQQ-binding-like beta-propeller repeat protein [Haloarchaeobius sp. HRN-SO-5]|uniref:PQQ-binding-like beta-propeller repeat protein n=1 Tax=Haloarchaeobius sp. HRN-SO-5 TaxID=3446118 RepID=UPI003EBDE1EF
MNRRDLLKLSAAGATSGVAGCLSSFSSERGGSDAHPQRQAWRMIHGGPKLRNSRPSVGDEAVERPPRLLREESSNAIVSDGTALYFTYNHTGGMGITKADRTDAASVWETPFEHGGIASPLAVDDEYVYGTAYGGILAVGKNTGDLVWRASEVQGNPKPPTVKGDSVYAVSGGYYESEAGLYRISKDDGGLVWVHPGEFEGAASVASGIVVVVTTDGTAVGIDAETGEKSWESGAGPRFVTPLSVSDQRAVGVRATGTVVCLDIETGAVRWNAAVERESGVQVAVDDGEVFVHHSGGITGLDIDDGNVTMEIDLPQTEGGPLVSTANRFIVGTSDGRVSLLERDGTTVWNLQVRTVRSGDLIYSRARTILHDGRDTFVASFGGDIYGSTAVPSE